MSVPLKGPLTGAGPAHPTSAVMDAVGKGDNHEELCDVSRISGGPFSSIIVAEKEDQYDAPCSVRVSRGDHARRQNPPERFLIGFDGSVDSWAALREAATRHWPSGAYLRLLTAIGLVYTIGDVVPEVERRHVREEQQRAENELSAAGFDASSVIAERDPKQALLEEAEAWKADMIFLGTSGMGLLGRLVLGSVSSAVAARSGCSVEVIRGVTPPVNI